MSQRGMYYMQHTMYILDPENKNLKISGSRFGGQIVQALPFRRSPNMTQKNHPDVHSRHQALSFRSPHRRTQAQNVDTMTKVDSTN